MFKRFLLTFTIIAISISFTACANNNKNTKPKGIENNTVENTEKVETFIFDDIKPYDGKKVKIAFVGDSITYGYRTEDPSTMSYPAVLSDMLSGRYNIGNFGKNASYVLKADDKFNIKSDQPENSYWQTKEFEDSKNFNPDIVILMLGTNDIRSIYAAKEAQDVFVETYSELVNEYKQLESVKEVFIATSINNHSSTEFIKVFADGQLQDLQKKTAELCNIEVFDIYDIIKEKFADKTYFNEDNIHLTETGYKIVAEAFYELFSKK